MKQRSGLTLVEMLVAAALTLMIMALLTEMFVTGLEAFRKLQGISEMDQQLRTATTQLRKDLSADHFDGGRRLSQLTTSRGYWNAAGQPVGAYEPPSLGFISLYENGQSIDEGADSIGLRSERDTDDLLHFTVRVSGNAQDDLFYAKVPVGSTLDGLGQVGSRYDLAGNGMMASHWAEILYTLQRDADGRTTDNGVPLYNLFRRQTVLAPDYFTTPPQLLATSGAGLSPANSDVSSYVVGGFSIPNTPSDIQFRENRYLATAPDNQPGGIGQWSRTTLRQGDQLVSNVLSFDVKVWDPNVKDFIDLGYAPRAYPISAAAPMFSGSGAVGSGGRLCPAYVYDTWSGRNNDLAGYANYTDSSAYPVPYPYPIKALQIKLRVWDPRTKQARETTIVQNM